MNVPTFVATQTAAAAGSMGGGNLTGSEALAVVLVTFGAMGIVFGIMWIYFWWRG